MIGTAEAAKAAPDGYTLLIISNTQTANESLIPTRNYELMRDFVAISPINQSDLVIVAHPSVNAKTVPELIALAKAQPGKLNYASSGQGTPYHMAGELFKAMTGTNIVHVPHRNSGEARASVLGGNVEIMIDAVPAMAQNIAAGQVRPLATTGKTRSKALPDVPTVHEAGVPGYEATIWLGLVAPAGTPKPVVDKLSAEMKGVLTKPENVKMWDEPGRGAAGDDAGRVRQVPARRHRQVGGRRQADQREQAVVASDKPEALERRRGARPRRRRDAAVHIADRLEHRRRRSAPSAPWPRKLRGGAAVDVMISPRR